MTGDLLVVDDSPQNTEVLATLLRSRGHSVRVANGGLEALALARERAPDLVLLDLHMPDMDGLEVCRTLRMRWAGAQMPVLFLSATHDATNKVKAFESGAADFVNKPFDFDEVLSRVGTHLALKHHSAQLEHTNVKLEHTNVKLRKVDEALRQFVTSLVHDIKNPLTPMLANTGWLLQQPSQDPETEEVVRDIHLASHHLHRMVLSLLDVARGSDQGLIARQVTVPMEAWTQSALCLTRLQLRSQPDRLQVKVAPGSAVFDPDLLSRVVQNLVDNAIKYSPRNHPIRVDLERGPDGLRLIVEDRGTGVRPEDRERVFLSWTRLEEAAPRGRASHGIGLAFCRQAVESHGGHIRVEDAVPHGARFVVTLPQPAHEAGK